MEDVLENIDYGKHVLIGQMYNNNHQKVGEHIQTYIHVVAEVQPLFVLPNNGSVYSN